MTVTAGALSAPMPQVTCMGSGPGSKRCFTTQNYRGQKNCLNCGAPLPAVPVVTLPPPAMTPAARRLRA